MKIKLLYSVVILLLFITFQRANAQFSQGINGKPILTKNYDDVAGSPFLNDQWASGVVKLADGRTYKDVPLKYNEREDELYFQDKAGQMLTFVDPVKEFKISIVVKDKLSEKTFSNGFKNIPNASEKTFFEVLGDGTTEVLKRRTKSLEESKEYNGPVTKRFDENVKYYLIKSGKVLQVKNDKKSIISAIGDKQPELETYIKANNLNMKNDDDIATVVRFYNSL